MSRPLKPLPTGRLVLPSSPERLASAVQSRPDGEHRLTAPDPTFRGHAADLNAGSGAVHDRIGYPEVDGTLGPASPAVIRQHQ